MIKTVILLGTAHRVQGAERGICNIEDPDYETLVHQLWLEYVVDFVFEEASGMDSGPHLRRNSLWRTLGHIAIKTLTLVEQTARS